MKKTFLSIAIIATSLFGCQSNAEQLFSKMCDETENYIDALEDVTDKDEYRAVKKLYNEKIKTMEDKFSQETKNLSYEKLQEFMNDSRYKALYEKKQEAEKAAYNRVNKR